MRSLLLFICILYTFSMCAQKPSIESSTLDLRYTDITLKEGSQPSFICRVSYLSNDRIWIDNNMTMRPFKEQVVNTLSVGYKINTNKKIDFIPYIGIRHEFNNTAFTSDARMENSIVVGSRFQYCVNNGQLRLILRRLQVDLSKQVTLDVRSQIDYTFKNMKLRVGTQFDTKTNSDGFYYLGGITFGYRPYLKKNIWLQAGLFTNTTKSIGMQLRTIMNFKS